MENTEIKRFEAGLTYETPSICDSECIFKIKVLRRTAKSVWIVGGSVKEVERRKISIYEGTESIYPFGKYSMCAVITADRKETKKMTVKEETQADEAKTILSANNTPFNTKGKAILAIMNAKSQNTHDAVEIEGGWIGKERIVPTITTSEHDLKKEEKADRYRDRAANATTKASQHYNNSTEIANMRPFGQPILVGHHSEKRDRRDQDKIFSSMRKSVEETEKADYYNQKAKAVENNTAISSDDSNAVIKLKEKLRKAEQNQEAMKTINKVVRNKKLSNEEKINKITNLTGWSKDIATKILEPDFCGRVGFPSYKLTNNNANIKRMKDRVKSLERKAQDETTETDFDGGYISDNVEANRVQIFFDSMPIVEIRTQLKSNGFRWARSIGAWQRHRSPQALYLAKNITKKD